MNEEERCNTTLGLGIGIGVEIKREKQLKQSKRSFWLDLSLPIHPKIEPRDDDHEYDYDDEKEDQDSLSSKTNDDQQEEEDTRMKRSSDLETHNNNTDRSRKKLKLTTEQTTLLENSFKIHSTLNTGQKQELAKKLKLLPRQIEVWFQNRRARTKLKQIEQECELLKKCCETLSDENRRLKRELQEARCCSLKTQPPLHFYTMRPPCDKTGQDTSSR